ncbi:MAG TPA: FKBP-type peptidyl-prolyl cis-trans isomerase [Prolixibacteraceae bacterium]|nr:FKBP-type peptidyl-prolyl cis-trans isomerase [Prolixibacteraceae bacterium]
MKQLLYILGLAFLLSGILYSCKKDSLEVMRDNEVATLQKYVKDHNLEDAKDSTGIYFKLLEPATNGAQITSGYKVMLLYKVTLIDDTTFVLGTEDAYGHNYEEEAFYVDVPYTQSDASPLQKVAGMHLGLKKMHVGDKAFIVIPSELAFKAVSTTTPYSYIPRFSTLLVTVYVKKGYAPTTSTK